MNQPYGSAYEKGIHESWRLYERAVRTLRGRAPDPAFAGRGYIQGTLDSARVNDVLGALRVADFMLLDADDSRPGFRRSEKVRKVGKVLNAGHRYYRLEAAQLVALGRMLDALREPVAQAIGSPWRVLNVRALETLPSAEVMGPNAWHGDGFPPGILKVMIYFTPVGEDTGTTEFRHDDNTTHLIEGPAGTWVVFKNSTVIHRGIPPRAANRVAVEVTLTPSLTFALKPIVAGLNATYPEYPWSLNPAMRLLTERAVAPLRERFRSDATGSRSGGPAAHANGGGAAPSKLSKPSKPPNALKPSKRLTDATPAKPAPDLERQARLDAKAARAVEKSARAAEKQAAKQTKSAAAHDAHPANGLKRGAALRALLLANRVLPPLAVNIGGGPEFAHFRWLNLEGARGPANPRPFRFTPSCTFPLRAASVATVYTSHCIEHLDDETVARVFAEARRVVAPGGRLVIKIPDFDMVLERWRADDESFFTDDQWGFRRIKRTWPGLGVGDTLDARAAMIFCGVWNRAYGDHFGGERSGREGAYHGPAPVAREMLEQLRTDASPHQIAAALRRAVLAMPGDWSFNHQNAWSRDELRAALECAGFEVVTFDTETVLAAAADIPTITGARGESLYCLARPQA